MGVYINDLIITGGDAGALTKFKAQMRSTFRMSDLGPLSYYLGLEVTQGEHRITLWQGAYATKILEKAGMTGCNPCDTPTKMKLLKEGMMSSVDATEYRSLSGSLRYLCNSRPDLAFVVGYHSRLMEAPRQEHLAAVRHVLYYAASTVHWARTPPGEEESSYADSDGLL